MPSSGEKDEPATYDAVAPDANCCIKSVLIFEKIESDYYASHINDLLNDCYDRNIDVVFFDFIEKEAQENLAPAIDELIEKRGVNPRDRGYARSKMVDRAREKLVRKFDKWICREDLNPNVDKIRKLFEKFEKEITIESGTKDNIPDVNDLKLIGCLNKIDCESGYIVSQDAHFCQYIDEIENKFPYDILILNLENLTQFRISWGWI